MTAPIISRDPEHGRIASRPRWRASPRATACLGVGDREASFGARRERYFCGDLGWDDAKRQCKRELREIVRDAEKAGQSLFFNGGRLEDYGFRIRKGIERVKVYRALNALLKSWDVSHEQKTLTVGLAIMNWCEPITASGIAAGTDETPAAAQPEGQEPGPQGDAEHA